jgi:beta-glucosidase
MSYSSFKYSGLTITPPSPFAAASYAACASIAVSVTVTNTGGVDSDEVIQLYSHTPDATVPAPRVRLSDFKRVHIPAGASVTVELTALPATRAVYYEQPGAYPDIYKASANQVIEKGTLNLFVGGGQPAYFEGGLTANVSIGTNATFLSCE